MHWRLSFRADPRARALADRHYPRRRVGAKQFVAPGRPVVLLTTNADALWVVVEQKFCDHDWPGAWMCSAFRNEGPTLSSELIVQAMAATRSELSEPPAAGLITFINPRKVRRKLDPGRCFLRAGFNVAGKTKRGLIVLRIEPAAMPPAAEPLPMHGMLFST
jgi:hypothetical protein